MRRMAIPVMISLLVPALLSARTFTVTNTSDDEEVVGSFRWAVERTEFWGSADTILFAIPRHDSGFD
ncbi:MAG: hypothetical protein MUE60_13325, partial [Candidatus Eisenbacteria bacterium]|nr:hypothetical protein [Candidatus Eisenbacteria bacterium]